MVKGGPQLQGAHLTQRDFSDCKDKQRDEGTREKRLAFKRSQRSPWTRNREREEILYLIAGGDDCAGGVENGLLLADGLRRELGRARLELRRLVFRFLVGYRSTGEWCG